MVLFYCLKSHCTKNYPEEEEEEKKRNVVLKEFPDYFIEYETGYK